MIEFTDSAKLTIYTQIQEIRFCIPRNTTMVKNQKGRMIAYITCCRSCLSVTWFTLESSNPSSLQTIAILSSGLLGCALGCKQHSAIFKTEPGSQVPPCFEGSEVSKTHLGASMNETESSLRTMDQYSCTNNNTLFGYRMEQYHIKFKKEEGCWC